ncbi:amine oxidase [Dyadobacter sp. CY326]|uniref:amine oxidase n=1 Tax=Dyadobacter sp. CY326 TaxID=2907300 RepID=UPI001F257925|nr:amine oxidase [Dyadobacter sp. CY326]MCE7068506.1 amine oxidase [Dyadobacter sp. CY326]
MTEIENPFKSFWMGGFECADQLNVHGNRVDLLKDTGHLDIIDQDYEMISQFDIRTVREGIRWSQVEYKPYQYDFSSVKQMILAGQRNGTQQIWDICHFGFPDDLTPLHPHFTPRFVALCKAFAFFYNHMAPESPLVVTPINEVGFISWLGGDAAGTAPYCRNNGWEMKYALMRAYIAGVKALKEYDPRIRILTTEPLINVVPEVGADETEIKSAQADHDLQYQAVDILCGKICPELGGKPEYLDMLGFNYYYNNQWVAGTHQYMGWNDPVMDTRWRSLSDLLREAHLRYDVPVVLTETSHPKEDRPIWISMVAEESCKLVAEGIPLWGVCYYPIIDRPDWDQVDYWHNSGIWDTDPMVLGSSRVLHMPSAQALVAGQADLRNVQISAKNQRTYKKKEKSSFAEYIIKLPGKIIKDFVSHADDITAT